MLELEDKVVSYCISLALFPKDSKALVALSGGGDSVALLHCLAAVSGELGITLEAAHLNHALRGAESDGDEAFCREMCETLRIPMAVKKLSKGELSVRGESLETSARRVRREFLRSCAEERGCDRIALGHTLNDQAETVLQRIIRGTGLSGLSGILPVSGAVWVRPLLEIDRDRVREYLKKKRLFWREDSSNREIIFFRNRIRHLLLPFLQENFSPAVADTLARFAELARSQEAFLEETTREAFRKCCIYRGLDKILLDVPAFLGYHTVLRQRIVRYCLEALEGEGRNTDMHEIEHVLECFANKRGDMDVTARVRCGAGKRVAAFAVRGERFKPVPVRIPGETAIPSGGSVFAVRPTGKERVDGRNAVIVSPGVIRQYGGLTIGPAQRGERMIPFGTDHLVKVRDIMSDYGTPRVLRDSIPVVRAGATAVWIPGMRSAECLRIYDESGDALLLVYADGPKWR